MLLCGYFLALTLSLISIDFDSTRRFMIVHFLYKAINIAEHLPLVNLLQLCLLVDEALLLLLQNYVALGHAFQHRRFGRVLLLDVDAAFAELIVLHRYSYRAGLLLVADYRHYRGNNDRVGGLCLPGDRDPFVDQLYIRPVAR